MPEKLKRYAFVLGKNPSLSLAELFTCLRTRSIGFSLQDRGRDFVVLDLERPVQVNELGGTIKSAEVFSTFAGDPPKDALEKAASLIPDRSLFGVSAYGSGWKELATRIKSLKGSQAKFMNIPSGRSALTHVEVIKRNLVRDSAEILLLSGSVKHLARTLEVHDPFEFQKRDMDRPFKRPMLSIPPRLARIMVNLTGQKTGVLLDPFCGIGTILQEACLQGFRVWGTDTDREVIPWARRNIKWLLKEYGLDQPGFGERIRAGDARKLPELFPRNSLDAIVTEPDLGPPLRTKPDLNRARRITRKLEPLFLRFVRGSSEILKQSGTLVTVSPYFGMGPGRRPVRINMEALASRAGLRLVNPLLGTGIDHGLPFLDHEERHRTIREISVLRQA